MMTCWQVETCSLYDPTNNCADVISEFFKHYYTIPYMHLTIGGEKP